MVPLLLRNTNSTLRNLSSHISPPPPQPATSERQLLTLLHSTAPDHWDSPQLLHLTSSIPPPRLPSLLRRLNSSAKALKFLQWAQSHTPSLLPPSHSTTYQALFELACREDHSHLKLLEILQISRAHSVPLTADSASILIRHFAKAGMVEESVGVFNEIDPLVKNTQLCNTMLDAFYRMGRVLDARRVLDEMLQPESRFPPDDWTGFVVFNDLVKRDQLVNGREVIELAKKLGQLGVFPNGEMLTKLITRLGRSGNNGQAWELLHMAMKMDSAVVEASSINSLLVGLARENDFRKMNLLLSEMKGIGVRPNGKTFGIIIHHLCKSRRVDEALHVLDNMKKNEENGGANVVPDIFTYNTVIKGLCVVGRQEEGLVLVDKMKSEHGYVPNIVTYNALIDGFCKSGEIERSWELFDQMKKDEVPPDVITLNTLVDGMCKHGRISSALEFFGDMQRKGLNGNVITFTSLISALCNVNNFDKAMNLFDEMVSSHCIPDSIVFYSLINGFSRAGRLDDACSVVSKMKSAGFFLDAVSYNVLISGFCKKKKLDKVYELMEEMAAAGIRADEVTYNTLIATFSKSENFSSVHQWMAKMTEQGLVPTAFTYGAVIHGYCRADKLDEAVEIFTQMGASSKVPPNTVIYNILIDSLCKAKRLQDALSLMDDMKVKGMTANVVTYNAILKGLRDRNYLDKAFELLDTMNEQAVTPDFVTLEILTDWFSGAGETMKLKKFVQGNPISV